MSMIRSTEMKLFCGTQINYSLAYELIQGDQHLGNIITREGFNTWLQDKGIHAHILSHG
jgi:hypothetical protein